MEGIIKTLDMICVAYCADFKRRSRAIADYTASRRTVYEYRYLNDRIFNAAMSVAGERDMAYHFIEEIGTKVGYANSVLADDMCELTYKRKKMEIKRRILTSLHLLDEK